MSTLDLAVFGRLTDRWIVMIDETGRVCGADPALDQRLNYLGLNQDGLNQDGLNQDVGEEQTSRLVGRSFADLATDPNAVKAYLDQCRQTSNPVPGKLSLLGVDGQNLAVRCRGCRASLADPSVVLQLQPVDESDSFSSLNRQLQQSRQELLRRREIEVELREALELNELILSSTAGAIIALDTDGIVTLCNAAALRMLGYSSADELVGQDLRIALSDSRSEGRGTSEIHSALLHPRETLDLRPDREILWRRDGSSFPIEYLARRIRRDDEVVGWVVSFIDISQRLEEEEKQQAYATVMHEAQKLESLGRLASGVAHDFNNFLLTIIGNVEMVRRQFDESSLSRQRLDAVLAASHNAGDLCRQMLALSGRGKVPMKPLVVSRLVKEISELLQVSMTNQVTVKFDFSADEVPVDGDASQLRQVVMNLLINASDAIGEGPGTITVRAGAVEVDVEAPSFEESFPTMVLAENLRSGRHAYLEFVDTGHGMEPEQVKKIFDPYFSTKDAGHGLGLAATLGIVRRHRGAIAVESQPGTGTRFRVLFPESTLQAGDPAAERKSDDEWRGSGTILVVDDNESVARVVGVLLKEIGFEVETIHDGQAAIDLFQKRPHKYTLVLLDVSMPKIDGFQVFTALRDIDRRARIVMSSGLEDEASTRSRVGEGLADFLPKPYSRTQLVGMLRRLQESGSN